MFTPLLFAQSFNKVYVSSGTELFKNVFKTDVGYDAFGMTTSGSGSPSTYDLLFAKLDSCGEVIHAYAYGGFRSENLTGVVQNSSGNYVVICQSLSYTSVLNGYEQDVLALEIKPNGDVFQSKLIQRSNNSFRSRERPKHLILCSSGGYLISGNDEGNGSRYDDPSILKLDNTLTPVWYRSFSIDGEDNAYGITELSSGRLITVYSEERNRDLVFMKHNAQGNVLKRVQMSSRSYLYNIAGTGTSLNDKSYFLTRTNLIPPTYVLMKVDSNLNLEWSKEYNISGGMTLNSIKEINGVLYATGHTSNNNEALILKLDTSGAVLWSKNIDNGSNTAGYLYNLEADKKGNLIGVGMVSNPSSGNDAFILLSDTSSSLVGCESTATASIQVRDFPLTSSTLSNPSEVNVFKSWNRSVTKTTLSLVDTNLCPLE